MKCIKIFHSVYKDFVLDFWVVHRVVKELDFEPDPRMIHMTKKAKECFTYAARQTWMLRQYRLVAFSFPFHRLRSFWAAPRILCCPFRWTRVTKALGTKLVNYTICHIFAHSQATSHTVCRVYPRTVVKHPRRFLLNLWIMSCTTR